MGIGLVGAAAWLNYQAFMHCGDKNEENHGSDWFINMTEGLRRMVLREDKMLWGTNWEDSDDSLKK